MPQTAPALFRELLVRELRGRFIGSFTGWLWLVINPLLLLAVYAFVFGLIFQARVPDGLDIPFAAWLAIALWPWLAFSDAVLRASESMPRHAGLISKVPISRVLLALTSTVAGFLLQLAGFAVVLLAIAVLVPAVPTWQGLPLAVLVLAILLVGAAALGLIAAALRVFVRDLEQLLPTVLMFWFFLSPILYPPALVPDPLQGVYAFNPMYWIVIELRDALLHGRMLPSIALLWCGLGSAALLLFARWLFARLSPHFEDFL